MNPLFRKHIFLGCALILAFSCSSKKEVKPTPAPSEIVVGQIDSLTGPQASFGIFSRSGIQLAVSKVNDGGGIAGKKIRLVSMDDQGKPELSESAAVKLVSDSSVVAILGATASTRSLAIAPVIQKHEIPMISPSSTNPKVTGVGNYVFRTCFIDDFQGAVMARFVHDTLKAKKVAILRDLGSEYSVGLSQFFKDKFVSMGGKVVAEETYKEGDVDFQPQLKAMGPKKPDLIYVPGYYTDVANIVSQARKLGIKAVFAGGDGWDSNELYKIGEGSSGASYFTNHYAPNSQDPVHMKFAAEYLAKYKVPPNADAALGYDAAMVLFDAMKRAKSLKGADLREAIAQTKNFPGVTGTISLDDKRNAVKSVVIFKVLGKKADYLQTINP